LIGFSVSNACFQICNGWLIWPISHRLLLFRADDFAIFKFTLKYSLM
jgi:hypothetical protein